MEAPRVHLQKILDLLTGGLWLEMDQGVFPYYFGGDIGRESAEVEAKRFAESQGCCFLSDGKTVKFGRAYPKRHNDV